jgi:hypothetical protein
MQSILMFFYKTKSADGADATASRFETHYLHAPASPHSNDLTPTVLLPAGLKQSRLQEM